MKPVFPLSRQAKKFFCAVVVVAILVGVVMGNAIIGGIIDEYHLPFSQWPVQLYVTEAFMIVVYSLVFTLMLSVPLWYFFLGEKDDK
ncbi:hypothetical protein BTJ39_03915 [Izhakiella australiensis]|uniref:DUF2534 domain-containing protein n=1 Tax=Izhakiella australiensis TaxID=1926881 RepID=A0A1S8YQI4_9GAMM|nr:DUF2534 family protein [Izhakiella australiensis]OON41125.1 hypothetical protein BTJ39_03915 [Izhakiella australiensis]